MSEEIKPYNYDNYYGIQIIKFHTSLSNNIPGISPDPDNNNSYDINNIMKFIPYIANIIIIKPECVGPWRSESTA